MREGERMTTKKKTRAIIPHDLIERTIGNGMPYELLGRLIEAIVKYDKDGIESFQPGHELYWFFKSEKTRIDKERENWKKRSETNSENGKQGGRGKAKNTAETEETADYEYEEESDIAETSEKAKTETKANKPIGFNNAKTKAKKADIYHDHHQDDSIHTYLPKLTAAEVDKKINSLFQNLKKDAVFWENITTGDLDLEKVTDVGRILCQSLTDKELRSISTYDFRRLISKWLNIKSADSPTIYMRKCFDNLKQAEVECG